MWCSLSYKCSEAWLKDSVSFSVIVIDDCSFELIYMNVSYYKTNDLSFLLLSTVFIRVYINICPVKRSVTRILSDAVVWSAGVSEAVPCWVWWLAAGSRSICPSQQRSGTQNTWCPMQWSPEGQQTSEASVRSSQKTLFQ